MCGLDPGLSGNGKRSKWAPRDGWAVGIGWLPAILKRWRCPEHLQEQRAEQARKNPHGQEEAWPAVNPPRSVGRDAAARHDHMPIRMMGHGREPQLWSTTVTP